MDQHLGEKQSAKSAHNETNSSLQEIWINDFRFPGEIRMPLCSGGPPMPEPHIHETQKTRIGALVTDSDGFTSIKEAKGSNKGTLLHMHHESASHTQKHKEGALISNSEAAETEAQASGSKSPKVVTVNGWENHNKPTDRNLPVLKIME